MTTLRPPKVPALTCGTLKIISASDRCGGCGWWVSQVSQGACFLMCSETCVCDCMALERKYLRCTLQRGLMLFLPRTGVHDHLRLHCWRMGPLLYPQLRAGWGSRCSGQTPLHPTQGQGLRPGFCFLNYTHRHTHTLTYARARRRLKSSPHPSLEPTSSFPWLRVHFGFSPGRPVAV